MDHSRWFQGSMFKLQTLFFNETKLSAAVLPTFIGIFAIKDTKLCFFLLSSWTYRSVIPILLSGAILVCSLLLLILTMAAHSGWTASSILGFMWKPLKKTTLVSQSEPIPHEDLVLKTPSDLKEPLLAPQTDLAVDRHDILLDFPADTLAGVWAFWTLLLFFLRLIVPASGWLAQLATAGSCVPSLLLDFVEFCQWWTSTGILVWFMCLFGVQNRCQVDSTWCGVKLLFCSLM